VRRAVLVRIAAGAGAAALVALSATLPLWTLTMRAPQYPKGLRLEAHGTGLVGDIRELNILNHYIGMPPIEAPAFETAIYPWSIAALVVLCLISPVHPWLRRLAIVVMIAAPLVILADLQWQLYTFGHSLNPKAPIRLEPFTPLVLGTSKMGNFVSTGMVSTGFACLVGAAALLFLGGRWGRSRQARPAVSGVPRTAAAAALALLAVTSEATAGPAQALQSRLAAAPPGTSLTIDGGVHQGPLVVRGPLEVIGVNDPVIDGGGVGTVVTIEGDGVVFTGFRVRNSGREVTEEAAGIKATGSRHRIGHNDIRDVYFGIHVGDGAGTVVHDNTIAPGEHHGARPGHGISVWHARDVQLVRNRISDARDGIYLSFTERVVASHNEVTRCRYGLHSMYSKLATFEANRVEGNLLGAALMLSDRLVLRGNRIEGHRAGSAAYGVLLKDIGDLLAEGNVIAVNRVGIYAEGVPSNPSRQAVIANNVIAGNEVGLALQSSATLTVTGNRIADNLTDVRPLGRGVSAGTRWSRGGRGNSWSQYRGYDADRDGVGDVPHRVEDAMDALVQRTPLARAFLYTPAHLALDAAARMFPLFRREPVLVDPHPLMTANPRGPR